MKSIENLNGPHTVTVEEVAMSIMAMQGKTEHCTELAINAGGNIVNVEIVVTAVNGRPFGRQYISDKSLPYWKRKLRHLLKI